MRVEVHKFGGTSVGDADRMLVAARRIADAAAAAVGADSDTETGAGTVVVTSAMSGVTDLLVAAAMSAGSGQRDAAVGSVEPIREKHGAALRSLPPAEDSDAVAAALDAMHRELDELLRAVAWIREITPRTRAALLSIGEKAAARLLAHALRGLGLDAVAVDADTFLDTDASFDEAAPLHGVCERSIRGALEPLLQEGKVPVVTGFCGRGPDGATTLLGRGGSDYTATLIAGGLGADSATIWTDIDGVYTADPRVVPDARSIGHLNFREAGELAFYGAEVLHQRTIIPVANAVPDGARDASGVGIPIAIRSTMRPDLPGTLVDGRFTPGSHPVKAISAVRARALISIEGKGMAGVPGVAARAFGALAEEGISVTMISQSSSETSICIGLAEDDALAAELALKRAFGADLSHGDVEEIVVRRGVGIVAAVGLGMAHTPGVARGTFRALADRGLNVLAIAQGSSELNISLAVAGEDVDETVRALHREWRLHRRDTGEETASGFDLLLLGCGQIGRALVELIGHRREHVLERFGLEPRVVALCDRSTYAFAPRGLSADTLDTIGRHKADGGNLAGLSLPQVADPANDDAPSAGAMVERALQWRLRRPVLVDVSNEGTSDAVYLRAMELGCDVVTANKEPIAGSFERFEVLRRTARSRGVRLRCEATVGAGLPVVETIEMLIATGDRLIEAEGCLSGTLGFLMTRLGEDVPLSDAVEEASALGYTEPDAAEDLSGADVERKAVILSRLAGFDLDGSVVAARSGVVPDAMRGLPRRELLARLRAEVDGPLRERVAACRERGAALRYVATVRRDKIEVGLREVDAGSPLGMLTGPDNMVVLRSERYADRPLVISGPGAGVEVTAMGVLSDILRIAAERRQP